MEYPVCEKRNCINYKEEHCQLKNPEKANGTCLDYEDAMDFLRLKADAIRGTLSQSAQVVQNE